MAWLQNLAGHAENLLNKIDQNAATVLSDGNKQISEDEEEGRNYDEKTSESSVTKPISNVQSTSDNLTIPELPELLETDNEVLFTSILEYQNNVVDSVNEENQTEKSLKSDHTSGSSSSLHNSFIITQELENLEVKITKLELENQDINKQLLNMQHLYSEMRNENVNLQTQIERMNEQLILAQNEKEQYVARAQRILQEKEKLISLKQTIVSTEEVHTSAVYNEELKKELEFQEEKVKELTEINKRLLKDLQSLKMQHQMMQSELSQSNQALEQNLCKEIKYRATAEEDCVQKSKELQLKNQEVLELQTALRLQYEENSKLKDTLLNKSDHSDNEGYEHRIKSLTQTLMIKQNTLETVTTERNALRLQLEKLEMEYKKNIAELKRDKVKVINIQETNDERISVPHFMRVLPHDAGVTRRMKHAYSTLDALSIRTGIFLRRYPLARVFVFCYMVILHIWVLTVLFWYVPSN